MSLLSGNIAFPGPGGGIRCGMASPPAPALAPSAVTMAVVVSALGYFVDIYDLLLFGIIRIKSLQDLGLSGQALKTTGLFLLDVQMYGMLLGGIIAGVIGDKRGRLSVLFGSIILYSLANIANGLVATVPQYAVARFIAGLGLAGELGAGITLVSELMKKESRGYGTAIVAAVGILGAVVASLVGELLSWRVAYFVGGGLGLALLLLRVGVLESGMFNAAKASHTQRGEFLSLFRNAKKLRRYLGVIVIGIPIWYVIALLVVLSPELAAAMGMKTLPTAGRAILFAYTGLVVGDLSSGVLSQLFKTRKKIVASFLGLTVLSIAVYFTVGRASLNAFYACCALLGIATGYWAVFMTIAAEQFGTNIRATVTTTAPNFVRGSVPLLTWLFRSLEKPLGVVGSAATVGALTLTRAFVALSLLDETYGKDLDYLEA